MQCMYSRRRLGFRDVSKDKSRPGFEGYSEISRQGALGKSGHLPIETPIGIIDQLQETGYCAEEVYYCVINKPSLFTLLPFGPNQISYHWLIV